MYPSKIISPVIAENRLLFIPWVTTCDPRFRYAMYRPVSLCVDPASERLKNLTHRGLRVACVIQDQNQIINVRVPWIWYGGARCTECQGELRDLFIVPANED